MALDRLVKLSEEFKFFFNMVVTGVNKLNEFAGGTIGQLGLMGFILFGKKGLRGGIIFNNGWYSRFIIKINKGWLLIHLIKRSC